jgi:predicted MPP superfamily phosphohydrolase
MSKFGMPGATERLRRQFFHVFLDALLVVIAISETLVALRIARHLGIDVGTLAYVAGAVGFYGVNTALVRRMREGRRHALVTGYAAGAFTALFGGIFLATAELIWTLVAVAAPPAVRLAGIVPTIDAAHWQPLFEAAVDIGLAAIGGLFVFGYTVGRRALEVDDRRIPIEGLPPALAGFRIVHISDLHLGAFLGPDELADHIGRINALAPDLICITGDLVDRASTCEEVFPVLAGLSARHGVVAILGNHDVAAGADAVTSALQRLTPFTVLRNARLDLERDGGRLTIVGLDDLGRDWARGVLEHPALPPLTYGIPADAPLIVLSHRPDCFEQAATLGARLVLSGHTHGGQIGFPGWLGRRIRNPAEFITRYDRGTFRSGSATLVVSNGLGFTGQPVRLFTPRQIGCLELQPA